jgi:hypothetical protein
MLSRVVTDRFNGTVIESKAPHLRGFSSCAEEDSNLHPVIPDQALKWIWAVCDASVWL